MKELVRYGSILGVICFVASGLLAGVNFLTKDRIIAQAQAEETASLKEVLTQAERFEPVKEDGEIRYYKAYDKDGRFIGAAFKVYGKGYSSTIETMVGMLNDGTLSSIIILNQNETPGLGTRVTEKAFIGQFAGAQGTSLGAVHAITGATISSKAVINSIKQRAAQIKTLIENER